jgi:hypothetical protein
MEEKLHLFLTLIQISFKPRPLYSQGKSARYLLERRTDGLQRSFGRCGEETIILPLSGIDSRFHDRPTRRPITTLIELYRLLSNSRVVANDESEM